MASSTPAMQSVDPPTPDQRTLAITFYTAARGETLQRLSMREQVLLASLTVSGVIAGFAFNGKGDKVLYLLPLFVLPFALAHVRHSQIIGNLGQYLRLELSPFLGLSDTGASEMLHIGLVPSRVRHWDCSLSLSKRIRWILAKEALVHIVLICGPAVGALVYLWRFDTPHSMGTFIIACISTTLALLIMLGQFFSAAGFKLQRSKKIREIAIPKA